MRKKIKVLRKGKIGFSDTLELEEPEESEVLETNHIVYKHAIETLKANDGKMCIEDFTTHMKTEYPLINTNHLILMICKYFNCDLRGGLVWLPVKKE